MKNETGFTVCPKCNSSKVIPKVDVIARGSGRHITALVVANPKAILFPGANLSNLSARICGDCGFTEIYAENPQILYGAYIRSQETK